MFLNSFFPSVLRLFVYFHFIYYRMGIRTQERLILLLTVVTVYSVMLDVSFCMYILKLKMQ